jgi:uncharacterized protein YjiS (DUF1127 family)
MEHTEMSQRLSVQTRSRCNSSAAPRRSMIEGFVHAIRTWFSRRRSYRELKSLDDHLLDDVGIPREFVREFKPPWWL